MKLCSKSLFLCGFSFPSSGSSGFAEQGEDEKVGTSAPRISLQKTVIIVKTVIVMKPPRQGLRTQRYYDASKILAEYKRTIKGLDDSDGGDGRMRGFSKGLSNAY